MVLEFIKMAGEQVVASVSGYLNRDHIIAILGNAVTVAAEEIGNAAIRAALGLTGTKDFVAKQVIRLVAGLGAWIGYRNLDADELALAVGTTLPTLVVIDLIKYFLKREDLEQHSKENSNLLLTGWTGFMKRSSNIQKKIATLRALRRLGQGARTRGQHSKENSKFVVEWGKDIDIVETPSNIQKKIARRVLCRVASHCTSLGTLQNKIQKKIASFGSLVLKTITVLN